MKSAQHSRSSRDPGRRGYRQEAEPEQSHANKAAVLEAAVQRLRTEKRLAEVTLEDIAADAGVTVRTILRQFGSKDGVMKAAFLELGHQIEAARPQTPPGDPEAAMAALLQQYEVEGDLNARVVAEEHEIPILHKLLQHARAAHRQWLTTIFGPLLTHLPAAQRKAPERPLCSDRGPVVEGPAA